MSLSNRLPKWLFFIVLSIAAAGCSSLPGLQVLTGQEVAQSEISDVVEQSDLVMADKTGSTDPSLMAAANRIEAAAGVVDMIEIRKDESNDAFVMNMLFAIPQEAQGNTQEAAIAFYTAIQRALEVSWQGTMTESQGVGLLNIELIAPQRVPTIDSNGSSFIGVVIFTAQIERSDAIAYLSGSRTLSDFVDLIADGRLQLESPPQMIYEGQPNHPLFMLNTQPTTEQTAASQ